jgi:bacillithiol biosynthesis cysteine-adding enzyme BshC
MTAPRIITESLGGSPLAVAAQRGLAREWFPDRPRGGEAWRSYLKRVAQPHGSGDWRRSLAPALASGGLAAARLDRVASGAGVVVSTGQQAALFGGPLYTLIKALSALGIADVLERETGIPTSAVFWAATDDADYEEACWAAFAVTGGARTVRLPPREQSGVPMSQVPLSGVGELVEELAASCGSVADPRPLALARELYTGGETLGGAYLRFMRALLEPLGIAVLDASHPAVRRAAAPVLIGALERAAPLERALRERYDAIRAAGYEPQVEHLPDLSLVFADHPSGEKRRIPVREAASYARTAPERLGPNVLLRPIVERFIMPSAAYVAGPGEMAYFAQVGAAAGALDAPNPLPLPRWSATILEPRVERLLARLGLERGELRDPHAAETRLARGGLPPAVAEALRALRADVERDVAALEVSDRDALVPPASLQGVRRWVLHRIERLERRYLAAVKGRERQLMTEVATARGALYPEGKPQERVLNFVPFLARYGAPLVDAMRAEALMHAGTLVHAGAAPAAADVTIAERV